MIKQFELFIDAIIPDEYLEYIKNIKRKNLKVCDVYLEAIDELIPRIPKHDLIIYDLNGTYLDAKMLTFFKDNYKDIFLLNAPADPKFYAILYENGISNVLRKGFFIQEYMTLLNNYMFKVFSTLEKEFSDHLIEGAQNSMVVTNTSGNIEYANAYFERISGYSSEEIIDKTPLVIKSGFHKPSFYTELWDTIKSGNVWEGIFINLSKSQKLFYEEATITPIIDHDGHIIKYIKIGKNITREKLLLDELSQEVMLARSVMSMLMPNHYKDHRIKFDYSISHYNEIGGDFIYFNQTSTLKYHYAIIDVMGHGVSSALIALTISQMFQDYTHFRSLEDAVLAINDFLTNLNNENPDRSRYVTAIFIEFDFSKQVIRIINTGHTDLLIVKNNGTISHCQSQNMLLGVMALSTFKSDEIKMQAINKVFTFTDGLFETDSVPYDTALEKIDHQLLCSSSENLFEHLISDFNAKEHIEDDITLCLIEIQAI